jgi:poly-gamma-glutamate capsule biosynthesis protein CapA/YwtB (metallophosphatase superfamily)
MLRLFLCGDVMTGRGIDQALPYPVNPVLYEPYVRDARDYVDLAKKANGPITRPLSFDYIWGEALYRLDRAKVDLRIVNLETVITTAETHWPGKEIHYRPRNVGCLSTARINACALANNHVLDWGYDGLSETLQALDAAAIAYFGRTKRERSHKSRGAQCAGQSARASLLVWIDNQRHSPRVGRYQHSPRSESDWRSFRSDRCANCELDATVRLRRTAGRSAHCFDSLG